MRAGSNGNALAASHKAAASSAKPACVRARRALDAFYCQTRFNICLVLPLCRFPHSLFAKAQSVRGKLLFFCFTQVTFLVETKQYCVTRLTTALWNFIDDAHGL